MMTSASGTTCLLRSAHVRAGLLVLFAALLAGGRAQAQDTRTVTEPVFPAVCTTLDAQLQQTDNVLPSSDETTFDTTRIQDALNSCASGEAVELALGSGGDNAFLIQPISIPENVTLLVDAGVTVYGSRDPRDYDAVANECGTVDSSGNGCNPLITMKKSGAAIMGYGVIDGRGGDTLIGTGAPSNTTWWQLASEAQTENLDQNNPTLVKIDASNITLYKITLQNSPMFHVVQEGTGFTVWDTKIIAPGTARNTDGIDPGPTQNATITESYIGEGDDNIALKPGGSATSGGTVSDISIVNNHFYVGHGMSIGSQTSGGTSNILVDNLNIDGDPTNSNDVGIRIKAQSSNGGLVTGVTYENVCMQNVASPIQFNPFYSSSTGSEIPQFQDITMSNVTVLTPGSVLLEGYSANYPLGLTLDNVNFTPTLPSSDLSAKNANITIGPGPSNLPVTSNSGNDVTVTNSVTNSSETPYACSSANFPTLAPEFFPSASQIAATDPLTLTAIFEPVIESPTTFVATEPTGTVTFYDGTTSVGSVTLSGSTDLATLTLSSVGAGAHSYTAQYSGDSNYAAMTTSPATVTVTGTTTTTVLTPASTTVSAGQTDLLTATVSASSGTPTGTVTFLDGTTVLGTGTLSESGGVDVATFTATLGVGSHSLTASYAANGAFDASVSTPVSVTVSDIATTTVLVPASTTLNTGQTDVLTATVSATGGSSLGTPAGTVTFLDGTTVLGTGTLNGGVATYTASLAAGSHNLTAEYAANGNFAASTSAAVTVSVGSAATVTTLTPAATTLNAGQTDVLTATVTASGGTSVGVPAGSVTFMDGSNTLATETLSASGSATYTATLAAGVHSLSAVYVPSGSLTASTSTAVSVAVEGFTFAASPASLTIAPGSSASSTLTFTGAGGLAGTVSYSCSGLPSYISCTSGSAALSAGAPATATMTFTVASTESAGVGWIALLPVVAMAFFWRRKRGRNARGMAAGFGLGCVALVLLAGMTMLSGCGGGSSTSGGSSQTPPAGSQTATVTATTTTAAGTITQSTTVTVNVQ